jgi:hypothetical protein
MESLPLSGTGKKARNLPSAKTKDGAASSPTTSPFAKEHAPSPVAEEYAPSQDEIARHAYGLWEERGAQHGGHEDDWKEAERQLRVKSNNNGGKTQEQPVREKVGFSQKSTEPQAVELRAGTTATQR